MGQKHSYSLDRAKVTRQSTQMIEDEVALNVSSTPPRPSEPVPLGLRTSMDSSDYVRREVERQELQQKERVPGVQAGSGPKGKQVLDWLGMYRKFKQLLNRLMMSRKAMELLRLRRVKHALNLIMPRKAK
uniref:Uncharacterized protein n=1 Tax=Globodera pallida TaxID=36090 RepID=A0A183CJA7_GLOPA